MHGLPNFFCKGHIGTIFSFAGHAVSVTITQLSHCGVKAVVDNK